MAFSISAANFDAVSFGRLLRRNSIDRAVMVLKILFVLLACLFFLLLAIEFYRTYLATGTQIAEFENRLAATLNAPLIGTEVTSEAEKKNYKLIAEKTLFGQIGVKTVAATPAPTPKAMSSTQFSLVGTFVTDGQAPFAIIEDSKKKVQEVFNLNDTVFDEATLVNIFNDRVELKRNNQIEILSLDLTPDRSSDTGAGAAAGEEEFVVDSAELDRALENLPLLLTQARAVPYFKEGKAVGLRLFAIRSGSLYEKLGLQNGDVLKSVNANSLADLSQAMQLFQKLKEEKSIALLLERNSAERTFRYQIR